MLGANALSMRFESAANRVRCSWASREPALSYHDAEWGVPEYNDRRLFELLTLEGAQAGLSWDTILRKRNGYRAAFAGFDPAIVASFDTAAVERLAHDPSIVRHRGKIASTVRNAAAFMRVRGAHGSFAEFLWAFVDGSPIVTRRAEGEPVPASTALSERISKDLRALGFTFVGPTIVYAFLQATGVVDDHVAACFRSTQT